jgi:RNA polymerase sigma-70 factor (ECF subfamily)
MDRGHPTSDEDLLASGETEAFALLYDRHARTVLGYFARRTGDPQVAADLTAETFASAIASQHRYRPTGAPALAWLFKIAARRLTDYERRGVVERRMRGRLAMHTPRLTPDDTTMIGVLADDAASVLLAEIPAEQREAVAAHVLNERDYAELASSLRISEAAVRQRVSRGLAALRRRHGGVPRE